VLAQTAKGAETPDTSRAKRAAAGLSVAFNVTVTCIKFVAAFITGSVSLLSESVHSATDLIASALAFVSVRVAAVPPDEEHPFGHGKIESLTGFAEAIMIFLVVIYIVIEAAQRLVSRHLLANEPLNFGLLIMGISAVGSLAVSIYMSGVAKRTGSTALHVNSQHLRIDFITSLGVFAGLAITKFTHWPYADPLLAILLAIWICMGAVQLSLRAFHELIDIRLPESEIDKIKKLIEAEKDVISYHRLRTRRSGSVRNIDFHIVVPSEWSVVQAHALADALEKRIRADLQPAEVVIHVDPYDPFRGEPSRHAS